MIRAATADDFKTVMGLYRQLNPDDPVLTDGSDWKAFEQILAGPSFDVLLLEVDGMVVATTYLNIVPNLSRSAASFAVIENVVVDRELRGTGIGPAAVVAELKPGQALEAWSAPGTAGTTSRSTLR